MTIIALIIAIIALASTIHVVRNMKWAAEEPCNGEEETLRKIDKYLSDDRKNV